MNGFEHQAQAGTSGIAQGTLSTSPPQRGLRGRPGLHRGDHGATAVEYAIMVSLIAVVIVSSVTLFGQNIIQLFQVPASAL